MTLAQHFAALDTLLYSTRQYWQCTAFDFDDIPWPELTSLLWAIDDSQVSELDADQHALYQYFCDAIDGVDELNALCELPTTKLPRNEFPFWISNGIKGRKFEQLQDFVAAISQNSQQQPCFRVVCRQRTLRADAGI